MHTKTKSFGSAKPICSEEERKFGHWVKPNNAGTWKDLALGKVRSASDLFSFSNVDRVSRVKIRNKGSSTLE